MHFNSAYYHDNNFLCGNSLIWMHVPLTGRFFTQMKILNTLNNVIGYFDSLEFESEV